MIIEYENNRRDYEKAYEKFRKTAMKIHVITSAIAVVAILVFPMYHVYKMSIFYRIGLLEYMLVLLSGIIAYVALVVINIKKTKKELSNLINQNLNLKPSCIGKKSIEITEGKIIFKAKNDYAQYNIRGLNDIFEYEDEVLLCTQKLNPMFIIPSRYFESEEQKNKFIELIKSNME